MNKSDEKPLEKAVPHHDDDDLFQYFNWPTDFFLEGLYVDEDLFMEREALLSLYNYFGYNKFKNTIFYSSRVREEDT